MEEVNMGGKRTQDMVHLLRCTTLYFVYRVFKKLFSSLALASPPWIQKQSTYRHSPYYPPCLQERVARQRLALVPRSYKICDLPGKLKFHTPKFGWFPLFLFAFPGAGCMFLTSVISEGNSTYRDHVGQSSSKFLWHHDAVHREGKLTFI